MELREYLAQNDNIYDEISLGHNDFFCGFCPAAGILAKPRRRRSQWRYNILRKTGPGFRRHAGLSSSFGIMSPSPNGVWSIQ